MRRAEFERDTGVQEVEPGRYRGDVTDRWHVLGDAAPNGGYLMAIAARAMGLASGRPDPVAVTGHFLRPPEVGPVEIATHVIKEGRRLATVEARVMQGGAEKVRVLGAFGDLTVFEGPTHDDREPPPLPSPDELADPNAEADQRRDGFAPPILRRYDHRMPAEMMGWAVGQPLGRGEVGGWCRFAGGEPMTTFGLLVTADAYPPAVFNLGVEIGWTPTIEMTVQLRKRPVDGWLRTRFTTRSVSGGLLEEDGEIWDADGDLVALSRQTALIARAS